MLEHHNNYYLKELIRHQRANVTFKSVLTASRSSDKLHDILSNVEKTQGVAPQSGRHTSVSREDDIAKAVESILKGNVLDCTPGRKLASLSNVPKNFKNISRDGLLTWIKHHQLKCHRTVEFTLH